MSTESNSSVNISLPSNSVIESDDIVYNSKDCPEPKPKPEKDCCHKTYHIVLNLH